MIKRQKLSDTIVNYRPREDNTLEITRHKHGTDANPLGQVSVTDISQPSVEALIRDNPNAGSTNNPDSGP